jgi:hypothetical protein
VIYNWSRTTTTHIRNLTGAAATADERNVLLYLTMRFAKTIKHIQGLQAYHAGDKLNVEVDIVLDEHTSAYYPITMPFFPRMLLQHGKHFESLISSTFNCSWHASNSMNLH